MWPMYLQSLKLLHITVKEEMHLQEIRYLILDLGTNVTWDIAQYPLLHVTYVPAKFDSLGGGAFTRKYIIWFLILGHTKHCLVPSTPCDVCTCKAWSCYIHWFRIRHNFKYCDGRMDAQPNRRTAGRPWYVINTLFQKKKSGIKSIQTKRIHAQAANALATLRTWAFACCFALHKVHFLVPCFREWRLRGNVTTHI